MVEFITNILKHMGCSHCQEYDFKGDDEGCLIGWKLYLKEYDMYSAMILYNDILKKDISYLINKNDIITLIDENNNIFIKLEFIIKNSDTNETILIPIDEYQKSYEKIEQMDKKYNKELNAYLIGIYNVRKSCEET